MGNRPDAAHKRAGAVVNGVSGLLILPDEWTAPDGFSFVTDFVVEDIGDIPNQYTVDEWAALEAAGAVFLPDCGSLFCNLIFPLSYYLLRTTDLMMILSPINYWEENGAKFGSAVRLVQLQSGNTTIKVE
jgi:hypothetical protein